MGYYTVLLFLCFYLLYVLVEEIFRNYLDEISVDKTRPPTINVIIKVVDSFIENKICSRYNKPLPPVPQSTDFHFIKIVCIFIASSIVFFIGYISGIRKQKCFYLFLQHICCRMNPNNYSDEEPSTCSLCLNVFKPKIVLLPCKHICICTNCWLRFYQESSHNCPICRENIEEVMNVYST